MAARPLPDWWAGDRRPLVYISFGSVTGGLPTASRLYADALATAADLPARVLLTVGPETDIEALGPTPPNVHVERWPNPDAPPAAIRASIDPAALREAVETVLADPAYANAARQVAAEIAVLPPTDEALARAGLT